MNPPLSTIYLVHHTHTDIGFTHEQPVVFDLHAQFIDQAIDLCERTADYPAGSALKWTCETAGMWLYWMRRRSDKQIQRFLDLEKQGRIELTGMFAVMSQNPSHESLYRQLYPLNQLRKDFGLTITSALQCDINGLNWGQVEALLDCGIDSLAMAINENVGRAAFYEQRPNGFYWEGVSGKKILTWNGLHYNANNYFSFPGEWLKVYRGQPVNYQDAVEKVPNLLSWLKDRQYGYPFVMVQPTFTTHVDNGPADPRLAEFVRWWNQEGHTPRMEIVTLSEYFKILRQQPESLLPTHRGEWTDYWNIGATSMAYETALNRRTYHRLYESDFARALTDSKEEDTRAKTREEAWESVWWYDEHTAGANTSVLHPFRQPARSQLNQKLNFAYRARSLAQLTRLEAIEKVAKSLRGEGDGYYVLAVNPLPWDREERLQFPATWLDTHAAATISHVQALDRIESSEQQGMGDQALATSIPVKVPAMGYRMFQVSDLGVETASPNPTKTEEIAKAENPWLRIALDSERGGIKSLFDKSRNREWVDSECEYPLGGYVHEYCKVTAETTDAYGGRQQIYRATDWSKFMAYGGWNAEYPAVRSGVSEVIEQKSFRLPGQVKFIQKCLAPGTRGVEYEITLPDNKPYVDLMVTIDKLWDTAPETCYVAFPFVLPGSQPRYQTAGGVVRPHLDQLQGSNQDFHTAQQWVDFSNEKCGVTITTLDTPIAMFGGFNIAQLFDAPRPNIRPLFLSLAMSNYYHCNYAGGQLGSVTFHYRIFPHDEYNVTESNRIGQEASNPLICHPVMNPSGQKPNHSSFLTISNPAAVLLALKPCENGDGTVLRLFNAGDSACETDVTFPSAELLEAQECDALEHPQTLIKSSSDGFTAKLAAGATQAYLVKLKQTDS